MKFEVTILGLLLFRAVSALSWLDTGPIGEEGSKDLLIEKRQDNFSYANSTASNGSMSLTTHGAWPTTDLEMSTGSLSSLLSSIPATMSSLDLSLQTFTTRHASLSTQKNSTSDLNEDENRSLSKASSIYMTSAPGSSDTNERSSKQTAPMMTQSSSSDRNSHLPASLTSSKGYNVTRFSNSLFSNTLDPQTLSPLSLNTLFTDLNISSSQILTVFKSKTSPMKIGTSTVSLDSSSLANATTVGPIETNSVSESSKKTLQIGSSGTGRQNVSSEQASKDHSSQAVSSGFNYTTHGPVKNTAQSLSVFSSSGPVHPPQNVTTTKAPSFSSVRSSVEINTNNSTIVQTSSVNATGSFVQVSSNSTGARSTMSASNSSAVASSHISESVRSNTVINSTESSGYGHSTTVNSTFTTSLHERASKQATQANNKTSSGSIPPIFNHSSSIAPHYSSNLTFSDKSSQNEGKTVTLQNSSSSVLASMSPSRRVSSAKNSINVSSSQLSKVTTSSARNVTQDQIRGTTLQKSTLISSRLNSSSKSHSSREGSSIKPSNSTAARKSDTVTPIGTYNFTSGSVFNSALRTTQKATTQNSSMPQNSSSITFSIPKNVTSSGFNHSQRSQVIKSTLVSNSTSPMVNKHTQSRIVASTARGNISSSDSSRANSSTIRSPASKNGVINSSAANSSHTINGTETSSLTSHSFLISNSTYTKPRTTRNDIGNHSVHASTRVNSETVTSLVNTTVRSEAQGSASGLISRSKLSSRYPISANESSVRSVRSEILPDITIGNTTLSSRTGANSSNHNSITGYHSVNSTGVLVTVSSMAVRESSGKNQTSRTTPTVTVTSTKSQPIPSGGSKRSHSLNNASIVATSQNLTSLSPSNISTSVRSLSPNEPPSLVSTSTSNGTTRSPVKTASKTMEVTAETHRSNSSYISSPNISSLTKESLVSSEKVLYSSPKVQTVYNSSRSSIVSPKASGNTTYPGRSTFISSKPPNFVSNDTKGQKPAITQSFANLSSASLLPNSRGSSKNASHISVSTQISTGNRSFWSNSKVISSRIGSKSQPRSISSGRSVTGSRTFSRRRSLVNRTMTRTQSSHNHSLNMTSLTTSSTPRALSSSAAKANEPTVHKSQSHVGNNSSGGPSSFIGQSSGKYSNFTQSYEPSRVHSTTSYLPLSSDSSRRGSIESGRTSNNQTSQTSSLLLSSVVKNNSNSDWRSSPHTRQNISQPSHAVNPSRSETENRSSLQSVITNLVSNSSSISITGNPNSRGSIQSSFATKVANTTSFTTSGGSAGSVQTRKNSSANYLPNSSKNVISQSNYESTMKTTLNQSSLITSSPLSLSPSSHGTNRMENTSLADISTSPTLAKTSRLTSKKLVSVDTRGITTNATAAQFYSSAKLDTFTSSQQETSNPPLTSANTTAITNTHAILSSTRKTGTKGVTKISSNTSATVPVTNNVHGSGSLSTMTGIINSKSKISQNSRVSISKSAGMQNISNTFSSTEGRSLLPTHNSGSASSEGIDNGQGMTESGGPLPINNVTYTKGSTLYSTLTLDSVTTTVYIVVPTPTSSGEKMVTVTGTDTVTVSSLSTTVVFTVTMPTPGSIIPSSIGGVASSTTVSEATSITSERVSTGANSNSYATTNKSRNSRSSSGLSLGSSGVVPAGSSVITTTVTIPCSRETCRSRSTSIVYTTICTFTIPTPVLSECATKTALTSMVVISENSKEITVPITVPCSFAASGTLSRSPGSASRPSGSFKSKTNMPSVTNTGHIASNSPPVSSHSGLQSSFLSSSSGSGRASPAESGVSNTTTPFTTESGETHKLTGSFSSQVVTQGKSNHDSNISMTPTSSSLFVISSDTKPQGKPTKSPSEMKSRPSNSENSFSSESGHPHNYNSKGVRSQSAVSSARLSTSDTVRILTSTSRTSNTNDRKETPSGSLIISSVDSTLASTSGHLSSGRSKKIETNSEPSAYFTVVTIPCKHASICSRSGYILSTLYPLPTSIGQLSSICVTKTVLTTIESGSTGVLTTSLRCDTPVSKTLTVSSTSSSILNTVSFTESPSRTYPSEAISTETSPSVSSSELSTRVPSRSFNSDSTPSFTVVTLPCEHKTICSRSGYVLSTLYPPISQCTSIITLTTLNEGKTSTITTPVRCSQVTGEGSSVSIVGSSSNNGKVSTPKNPASEKSSPAFSTTLQSSSGSSYSSIASQSRFSTHQPSSNKISSEHSPKKSQAEKKSIISPSESKREPRESQSSSSTTHGSQALSRSLQSNHPSKSKPDIATQSTTVETKIPSTGGVTASSGSTESGNSSGKHTNVISSQTHNSGSSFASDHRPSVSTSKPGSKTGFSRSAHLGSSVSVNTEYSSSESNSRRGSVNSESSGYRKGSSSVATMPSVEGSQAQSKTTSSGAPKSGPSLLMSTSLRGSQPSSKNLSRASKAASTSSPSSLVSNRSHQESSETGHAVPNPSGSNQSPQKSDITRSTGSNGKLSSVQSTTGSGKTPNSKPSGVPQTIEVTIPCTHSECKTSAYTTPITIMVPSAQPSDKCITTSIVHATISMSGETQIIAKTLTLPCGSSARVVVESSSTISNGRSQSSIPPNGPMSTASEGHGNGSESRAKNPSSVGSSSNREHSAGISTSAQSLHGSGRQESKSPSVSPTPKLSTSGIPKNPDESIFSSARGSSGHIASTTEVPSSGSATGSATTYGPGQVVVTTVSVPCTRTVCESTAFTTVCSFSVPSTTAGSQCVTASVMSSRVWISGNSRLVTIPVSVPCESSKESTPSVYEPSAGHTGTQSISSSIPSSGHGPNSATNTPKVGSKSEKSSSDSNFPHPSDTIPRKSTGPEASHSIPNAHTEGTSNVNPSNNYGSSQPGSSQSQERKGSSISESRSFSPHRTEEVPPSTIGPGQMLTTTVSIPCTEVVCKTSVFTTLCSFSIPSTTSAGQCVTGSTFRSTVVVSSHSRVITVPVSVPCSSFGSIASTDTLPGPSQPSKNTEPGTRPMTPAKSVTSSVSTSAPPNVPQLSKHTQPHSSMTPGVSTVSASTPPGAPKPTVNTKPHQPLPPVSSAGSASTTVPPGASKPSVNTQPHQSLPPVSAGGSVSTTVPPGASQPSVNTQPRQPLPPVSSERSVSSTVPPGASQPSVNTKPPLPPVSSAGSASTTVPPGAPRPSVNTQPHKPLPPVSSERSISSSVPPGASQPSVNTQPRQPLPPVSSERSVSTTVPPGASQPSVNTQPQKPLPPVSSERSVSSTVPPGASQPSVNTKPQKPLPPVSSAGSASSSVPPGAPMPSVNTQPHKPLPPVSSEGSLSTTVPPGASQPSVNTKPHQSLPPVSAGGSVSTTVPPGASQPSVNTKPQKPLPPVSAGGSASTTVPPGASQPSKNTQPGKPQTSSGSILTTSSSSKIPSSGSATTGGKPQTTPGKLPPSSILSSQPHSSEGKSVKVPPTTYGPGQHITTTVTIPCTSEVCQNTVYTTVCSFSVPPTGSSDQCVTQTAIKSLVSLSGHSTVVSIPITAPCEPSGGPNPSRVETKPLRPKGGGESGASTQSSGIPTPYPSEPSGTFSHSSPHGGQNSERSVTSSPVPTPGEPSPPSPSKPEASTHLSVSQSPPGSGSHSTSGNTAPPPGAPKGNSEPVSSVTPSFSKSTVPSTAASSISASRPSGSNSVPGSPPSGNPHHSVKTATVTIPCTHTNCKSSAFTTSVLITVPTPGASGNCMTITTISSTVVVSSITQMFTTTLSVPCVTSNVQPSPTGTPIIPHPNSEGQNGPTSSPASMNDQSSVTLSPPKSPVPSNSGPYSVATTMVTVPCVQQECKTTAYTTPLSISIPQPKASGECMTTTKFVSTVIVSSATQAFTTIISLPCGSSIPGVVRPTPTEPASFGGTESKVIPPTGAEGKPSSLRSTPSAPHEPEAGPTSGSQPVQSPKTVLPSVGGNPGHPQGATELSSIGTPSASGAQGPGPSKSMPPGIVITISTLSPTTSCPTSELTYMVQHGTSVLIQRPPEMPPQEATVNPKYLSSSGVPTSAHHKKLTSPTEVPGPRGTDNGPHIPLESQHSGTNTPNVGTQPPLLMGSANQLHIHRGMWIIPFLLTFVRLL